MKIRTQLAVAFLLLAVVPLAGIVLYSYFSSLRAIRQETETQARTLEARMTSLKGELGRGFERIGDVPAGELLTAARSHQEGRPDPLFDKMVLGFGEAAPLLRSLEFIPVLPPPQPSRRGEEPSAPPAPPAPGSHAEVPHLVEKVIIDVPGILRHARRAAELAPEADPHTLAAIDAAMEVLAEPGLVVPAPPAIPSGGNPTVDAERIRKEVAKQMAESRKALADARAAERERQRIAREKARVEKLMIGRSLEMPVWEQGKIIGTVKAQIRGEELLRRVLTRTPRHQGEIPFAVDAEGKLHTIADADRRQLEGLQPDFAAQVRAGTGARALGYWAVATSKDPESGLVFGIARPAPLQAVRRTAARNFAYGLGMIGLALLGILPLSTRMTRNLKMVSEGADRIAHGDLEARVPVRSRNEFGRLALAFNRMAEDLKTHQERLLEEERLRQEREMEQALLQSEYERKTRELEEARRFQLSLLPKSLPDHPGFEVAVSMRTATEVGGDYYDFHLGEDGALTVAVGDATGHGAVAGTMVTVVKSLFSAGAGSARPREFLDQAAQAVKRMELGRMAMGLCLARLAGGALTLSSAGMPPIFVRRRASGEAEEIALQGMPLGGLASDYQERTLAVEPGDTILLMTDGLPELPDGDGDPLGYPRVRSLFESLGGKPPEEIIAGLAAAADSWSGGQPPKDDITFVVLRVRARSTPPSA